MTVLNRRTFMLSGTAVTLQGLLVGVGLPSAAAESGKRVAIKMFEPNVWVHIPTIGPIQMIVHRSEMGQQVRTSCAMLIAEELHVELSDIQILQADGDKKYGDQNTDGSTSARKNFHPLRKAGAQAREMLRQAAAKHWKVSVAEVSARKGVLHHRKSGKSLRYQQLAGHAAKLPVVENPRILSQSNAKSRVIGKFHQGIDNQDMVTGKAVYGMDVEVEGMLFASIERCPVPWSGELRSYDQKAPLKVPGVTKVVHLEAQSQPINTNESVAVVAESYYAALKGRASLACKWQVDEGLEDSAATLEAAKKTAADSLRDLTDEGDFDDEWEKAEQPGWQRHSLELVTPYIVHAQMEPLVCTAHVRGDRCDVWAPTQAPQRARSEVADFLGWDEEQVHIHVTLLGGGFGRKSQADFVNEAVALSQELGKPVKVVWTREDDTKHGFKHAWSLQKMDAVTNDKNQVTGWRHRSVFPTLGTVFSSMVTVGEMFGLLDMETGMGVSNMPYTFPSLLQEAERIDSDVRIGWLRAVCNNFHAFGVQSMMDQLAAVTKTDPVDFHLAHLKRASEAQLAKLSAKEYDYRRYEAVIHAAAEMSGWRERGKRALGFAAHYSFFSYVAAVAEVVKDDSKRGFKVTDIWLACDCGRTVNADTVVAQLEGAGVFGLSMALHSRISIKDGQVVQSNFDDFEVARMADNPRIHVKVIESEEDPTGVGEPGVPPIPPAIANAVTVLKGQRPIELPIA